MLVYRSVVVESVELVGGWLSNESEKLWSSKWVNIFPKDPGAKKKMFEVSPPSEVYNWMKSTMQFLMSDVVR